MSCRTRWEGPPATAPDTTIEELLKASIARADRRKAKPEHWTITIPPSASENLGGGVSAPVVVMAEAPVAAIPSIAGASGSNGIADVLSPSQVNGYLNCSAAWKYRYVDKLPSAATGNQVRGRAVHALVGYWFRQRMAGATPDSGTLAEAYTEIWDNETADAEFSAKESIEELRASGAELANKYITEVGHKITPAASELKVSGVIGGVNVRGYVDLLVRDASGKIIDLKTSSRSPSGVSADHALQLATYARLTPEATGLVQLDTLVANKTPKLVSIEYQVPEADILLTERIYPAVQKSMRDGFYLPNRGSYFCSRKHCSFVDACTQEFGGLVE
jgi:putative RecB family exonuclease